jgi:hypothetical protein
MSLEGHNVVAEDNDFPPFNIAQAYVLCLQPEPNESFYTMTYGPEGAFEITSTGVRQMSTKFGTWNAEQGTMNTPAFVAEIRRMMAVQ